MPDSPQSAPFQVDLRGVVNLLSRHIYSGPRVYLRELLQNGVDAISARREYEQTRTGQTNSPKTTGLIQIIPFSPETGRFEFTDNGIGLTQEEAAELLSTVGATSKRDILDFPREDYLGQFGIGLLSCFMVADEIRVVSQSARGGRAIEWIGSASGSFTIRELDRPYPPGTTVYLQPRFDGTELLSSKTVTELATNFGEYLPVRVVVGSQRSAPAINRPAVFLQADPDPDELSRLSLELAGQAPLATIPLDYPQTGTRGLAFVLPFSPTPGANQSTRLYLGRMLVSARADRILPEWAFFVRACLNSTGLSPTASREDIVEDYKLELTRDALGQSIRDWLVNQATRQTSAFKDFLAVHQLALKQMVLHDDDLAKMVTGYLTLETSIGRKRIDWLLERYESLRYTETTDEFRQVAGIGRPGDPIVNGGYLWDTELVLSLGGLYGISVTAVDVLGEVEQLDPPAPEDQAEASALEKRASAVLADRDCEAVVRSMSGPSLPAWFVADPELFRRLDRNRAREASSPLWQSVLDITEQAIATLPGRDRPAASRLCLNWNNAAIRAVARIADGIVLKRCVQLLYAQAQLASHRPLSGDDRDLLATSLTELIMMSAGAGPSRLPPNERNTNRADWANGEDTA
ncbi:MAG: HSP90 family protein [Bifidobacteriaceae bacterium]|jgi:molecular chaperone HtpG|nr:HSP90 family protein [Bifidobacteriaceae bacterium]